VRPLAMRIEEATAKAAELTRQLLAMGRRQTLEVRPLRVGEIVADLVPMLERVLPEDFELDVNDEAPEAWVRGDRNELERVILNLVLNARDAMPRGGTIELRTAVVTLGRGHRNSGSDIYVRMSVRDYGHGMDRETQTLIFEPFFTTKELGRGTGLGLATVQGVVEQHEGFVEVESQLDRGSTFHVYFPLSAAPRDSQVPESPPSGETPLDGGGARILLVEDDALVRKLAHDVLADAGFDVIVALDGERALELAADLDKPIDLLLTDVIMPRASGPEIARVLRDARPDLRVLYMSGHPADELGARGLVERDVDLLRKPFGIEELIARVARALRVTMR
jgi:two-component system, cell cycle sensor histidine kinase and response regulator CckA